MIIKILGFVLKIINKNNNMKKTLAFLAIIISLSASAQKKDTTEVQQDTAYLLTKPVKQVIEAMLRQSSIQYNGKALTFDEVLQVIQELNAHEIHLPKKEQPKK